MNLQTKRKLKIAGLVLLLLTLFGEIAFLSMELLGKKSMLGQSGETVEMTVPELENAQVEVDGDYIIYNGEKYLYNENITSILCMGIDKEAHDENAEKYGIAGQADMLMLAILDTETGKVKLWNISRDAMTEVDIYNVDGEFVRREQLQACLAFAYGDGSHESCENTVKAVSRLFYGIPIQSYAALDMEAIQPLNDAIGGVEVTIHEGDILPARFQPGTTVLLKGQDARAYVQSRRTELPDEALDSNNNRMARQRQYMTKFINKALQMTKEDLSTPITLFNIARDGEHLVTNLNVSRVAYLATILTKVNFTEESLQTIPGEVVAGKEHAEYHVDDEALYQMILDTFYVKQ